MEYNQLTWLLQSYPLERFINSEPDAKTITENIDIGGPNLIRAAAKNFVDVIVIVNPGIILKSSET